MRSKITTTLLIMLTFTGIVAMVPLTTATASTTSAATLSAGRPADDVRQAVPNGINRPATAAPASAQAICNIWVGGHHGQYICEYGYTFWEWADGRDHWFVIGTDYAVWNILQNSNGTYTGWRSLGGTARSGVYIEGSPSGGWMDISVVGTDLNWWCNYLPRLGGPWNGWGRC